MRLRLTLLAFTVFCVFSSPGWAQLDRKFSLTLFSGEDSNSRRRVQETIEIAKTIEDCREIRWVQNSTIDRLVGVFDSNLAGRIDGERTILPIVKKIKVQQPVAFRQRSGSKMTDDDIVRICRLLPWDPDQLPDGVEFYRDFADPLEYSSFSSSITDEPAMLGFLTAVSDEIGEIRYMASTLLNPEGGDVVSFSIIGAVDAKRLANTKLELPDCAPFRSLVIGSDLILLAYPERDDKAIQFLNKWMDRLELAPKK